MKLRKLKMDDAPFMLEWMHDESIVCDLNRDFSAMTITDCQNFIQNSEDTKVHMHLAIVDDKDEYQGTVSLKHIEKGTAEFGITIRSCAMGKGFSRLAMQEIFSIAKEKLGLHLVYWCVSPNNKRALRFYDKNGYKRVLVSNLAVPLDYTKEQCDFFIWYAVEL